MPRSLRVASGLLLVFPALILANNAVGAIRYRIPEYLVKGLPLVLFLIVVSVFVWRGRQWAYACALVASAGLAAILMLYEGAVWWVWREETWEGWTATGYVLHFLPTAALGAAFVLLVRETAFGATRRRAFGLLGMALAVELVLIAAVAVVGYGPWFGERPWHHTVLQRSQVPGMILLTQMGMCCGYENHTIISDGLDLHWGPITLNGLPTLITANAVALLPMFVLVRSVLMRVRGAGRATPVATA